MGYFVKLIRCSGLVAKKSFKGIYNSIFTVLLNYVTQYMSPTSVIFSSDKTISAFC